jgi:hypothetical protein
MLLFLRRRTLFYISSDWLEKLQQVGHVAGARVKS